MLHTALNNLQNFDRSLDKFLAWLSEVESVVENLESDPESRRAAQQLKEIQADLERQAPTHAALRQSNLAILGTLSSEDALMLQLRGDEMERRWQVRRLLYIEVLTVIFEMWCQIFKKFNWYITVIFHLIRF